MKNILLSLAVAATLLVGLATPNTAEARPRGWYGGRAYYGYGYRPYYYGNYGYSRPYYGYGYGGYYPRYSTYYRGYPGYYGGYTYPGYYGGYGYGYPNYGYGTGIGFGGMRGGVYVY
jgi:hypothetical protein